MTRVHIKMLRLAPTSEVRGGGMRVLNRVAQGTTVTPHLPHPVAWDLGRKDREKVGAS